MNKILLKLTLFVILVTVQFSAAAQKTTKPKAKSYDREPILREFSEIPSEYRGHDPKSLFASLKSRPVKDEYETTQQYEEKVAVWESKPLYGNVKVGDKIAIKGFFLTLQKNYNADTQTLTFNFDQSYQSSAQDPFKPFISIDSDKKTLSSKTGQTVMGVKFRYERSAFKEFGIKFNNLPFSSDKYTIKVAPEDAKSSIIWDILYIGKLSYPYYFSEQSYHEPTLSERYESLVSSDGVNLDVEQLVIYITGKNPRIIATIPIN